MTSFIPDSKLIRWCQRLALLMLLLVPISVGGVRFGLFGYQAGLVLFALACLAAGIILLLMLVACLMPRYSSDRSHALLTALASLPPVLLMANLASSAADYPPIHDIVTNPDNPPEFIVGKLVRNETHNSLEIKPEVVAMQREAYPDITTIVSELTTREAFRRAEDTVDALGWNIYNSDFRKGLIEASVTSEWFGFVDDIVVDVQRRPGGTYIDLRSISRVGRGDLGANANRIRAFRDMFESDINPADLLEPEEE